MTPERDDPLSAGGMVLAGLLTAIAGAVVVGGALILGGSVAHIAWRLCVWGWSLVP